MRMTFDRRKFAKAVASAAVCSGLESSAIAKSGPRPFEVVASLYAWELHDEGVERVLDNLQSMSQVNSVYLISIMHYEKRPFTSPTFPHNPVRQTWQAEDSRCYWHPDTSLYGRIKPQLSSFSWLSDTDWLDHLTKAARKRGLKTGAELSHTLVDQDVVQKGPSGLHATRYSRSAQSRMGKIVSTLSKQCGRDAVHAGTLHRPGEEP